MVQDHHTKRSSRSRYFKGYCFSCNMFGHKAVDCYRRNMKHVRCYACNKLGHIARESRRIFWAPYQRRKTSSQLNIWKKKEVQQKICGIAVYTDMTHLEKVEEVEPLCSKSHMLVSWRQDTYIRELDAEQSRICCSEENQQYRSPICFSHYLMMAWHRFRGSIYLNNALFAFWWEVFGDDAYIAKWYILLLIGWSKEWYCRL